MSPPPCPGRSSEMRLLQHPDCCATCQCETPAGLPDKAQREYVGGIHLLTKAMDALARLIDRHDRIIRSPALKALRGLLLSTCCRTSRAARFNLNAWPRATISFYLDLPPFNTCQNSHQHCSLKHSPVQTFHNLDWFEIGLVQLTKI